MLYIIDGYNLIHRVGILDDCNEDYKEARDSLFTAIDNGFRRRNSKDTSLIFYDSSMRAGNVQPPSSKYVKIRFAPGISADSSIFKFLEKLSNEEREKTIVVSSDEAVRANAMFLYARTMSAEEFWETI